MYILTELDMSANIAQVLGTQTSAVYTQVVDSAIFSVVCGGFVPLLYMFFSLFLLPSLDSRQPESSKKNAYGRPAL